MTTPSAALLPVEYPATADDLDDAGHLRPDREWSTTREGYVVRMVDAADAAWMTCRVPCGCGGVCVLCDDNGMRPVEAA